MPTPTKGARLGGSPSHQRLILANLATALFEHGRITTTEAKARRLRPYAEQLITKAKTDTVANRRQVVKVVRDKSVLHAPATSSAAPVEEPTAEETPAVNAADDSAEVETDVVAGAPATEAETEPATETEVEAAAEAVEGATDEDTTKA